jgi:HK97 family phage major capsid protein/HK97 family phage prohead protease
VKEIYRRFLQAEMTVERAEGKPLMMTFSASSEAPYERWFGTEILSHDQKAVRLDRANTGAMPLLFNHNMNDPLGMIDKAWLSDGRMMVRASLFNTARAQEVMNMVDGGLRNVSIAYKINKIEENTKTDEFTVTDWEPFETSIVTVPADPSVGIGREYEVRMFMQEKQPKEEVMEKELVKPAAGTTMAEPVVEGLNPSELKPAQYEEIRQKAIKNLCKMMRMDDRHEKMFIAQGWSIEDVTEEATKILEKRGQNNPQTLSRVGLTGKETESFSIMRAIRAIVDSDWSEAGFELECSRAIAKRLGKISSPQKFYVPYEVMERQVGFIARNRREAMQRDLTVGTDSAGGFLKDTRNMGFIEMLRNRSVAFRMGARRLSGLVGNVTIPRQTTSGTMYWLATEATSITESQQVFDQVSLSPNNAGAYTEISRQLLLQSSPGAEEIVTNDLSAIVAIGMDKAVLHGTGTEQPQGIVGASGVLTVGSGPTISYGTFLEAQSDVAGANVVPVSGGYVTTPVLAAQSMQRVKFPSTATPLWDGNLWDANACGYPAMSSNQVNSGIVIFGDWNEIIIAEWGVLEIDVNPYANFQAGIVGVRCMYSVDVGIKRPAAFSTLSSAV